MKRSLDEDNVKRGKEKTQEKLLPHAAPAGQIDSIPPSLGKTFLNGKVSAVSLINILFLDLKLSSLLKF
jgi:hypothetical protein